MTDRAADLLRSVVGDHPVPGAGFGVWHDGRSEVAHTGVTGVEHPLPVDADTRFQIGSITKTYTVTAVLRLVHEGALALDDPVRRHVPELRLEDEEVAATVTVRRLLDHTAGWDGSQTSGADDPDAPLADVVAAMAGLEQLRLPGTRAEYNNTSLALAGRLVEKVTGRRYEDAVRALLLEPLGLSRTAFTTDDLMTERCAVGHLAGENGYEVARPWRWPRGANPEGGLVSTVADQLAWAAFHLDGHPDVLDEPSLHAMRAPSMSTPGNAMGDAIGLGWWLRDVAGEPTAGHQGTTSGQFAELRLVPSHRFAVVAFANGGPAGTQLTADAVAAALDQYLGLRPSPPRLRPYDAAVDGDVTGVFENSLSRLTVAAEGGRVRLQYAVRAAAAASIPGGPPDFDPCRLDLVDGPGGTYVVGDGPFAGSSGSFSRDASGAVTEMDFGGRWHRRADG